MSAWADRRQTRRVRRAWGLSVLAAMLTGPWCTVACAANKAGSTEPAVNIAPMATMATAQTSREFIAETQAWRAERLAKLTAPDSWLSLIGLHFLRAGENRVGRGAGSEIQLAAGPEHLGVATLHADGRVEFALAEGVAATLGEGTQRHGELEWRTPSKATTVRAGSVSLFVIERGGEKALRVRDAESTRRKEFLGIDYFPIDASWKIEARWESFERARPMPMTNILGQTSMALVPGRAVFEREGKTYALLPYDQGPGYPMYFVIADATTGKETYGAARFFYVERPSGTSIVLDFNRAENPPCAFTPFATCPLPPKENRMPFAITAGEKDYRGKHD